VPLVPDQKETMSILQKLKESLLEDDDKPTASASSASARPVERALITPASIDWHPPQSVYGPSQTPFVIDDELKAKVEPQSGPLVLFLATVQSLASFLPDEGSRYRAALAALAAQGITGSSLASEIKCALERINSEATKFTQAKGLKISKEIDDRTERIRVIEGNIHTLSAERDQLSKELKVAADQIEARAKHFEASAEHLRSYYEAVLVRTQEVGK
jgi:hypothetical protein